MIRRVRALAELQQVCVQARALGMPGSMVRAMRAMALRQHRAYPFYSAAHHARLQLESWRHARTSS